MTIGSALRYLQQGEWAKAHPVVQKDESAFGCWAHGIVHVLEGDLPNARYWYRRARRPFPADYDSKAEIAALAAAVRARPS